MTDFIFIKGPVPRVLEADLRRLCSVERSGNGVDYGETFAQVVQAGVQEVERQRCARVGRDIQSILHGKKK